MAHLIDSHCHLTYDGLYERIDDVVSNASRAGVGEFITVATDAADAEKALALSARHPSIHVAAGVHPHQAAKAGDGWDRALKDLAARQDIVAVGETGLDYHYDFSDRSTQHRIFRRQLELASDTGKPVIIHCREAHSDTLAILAEHPGVPRVVFHCFTGTESEAAEILACGYWISLTGVVTFKRSDELRRVAALIPADRLMVETDSPYLSPEPVRSMRPNEPANVRFTAACIADQRGLSLEELTELTSANARRFFNLPQP